MFLIRRRQEPTPNGEEIIGRTFNHGIEYDSIGRAYKKIYPSGYYTENTYDKYGYLTEVTDGANRSLWKPLDENARGQLTKESRGGVITSYGFDDRGFPVSINAPGIIGMEYSFDTKGNLGYRIDNTTNQRENFTFDVLNRLTNWDITNGGPISYNSITYDSQSNISQKTDLGNFTMNYGENGKPHALTSISGVPDIFPSDSLAVTYTDFKKICTLTELDKHYTLTYGVDDQRRKSEYKIGGVPKLTRYYLGDYEEELDDANNIRKIHYLSGGAILIDYNGTETLYYGYHDYQGSLLALTDESGTAIVERYAYNPWGKRRDPNNWELPDTRTSWMVNRGYTMHEHLDAFGIINMNGRVYDPLTASFFSPDPYVQAPGNWLNYNRYAYCYGNPFKYTDPDGEIIIPILIGAAVSVITNGINNVINDQKFFDGAGKAALIGGIGGAFSFGIGQAAMGMSGLGKVAFQTVAHGHLGGMMSGISGGTYGQGFLSGAAGSLIGGGASSLLKNSGPVLQTLGTVSAGALAGGIGAEIMGGNFWDGARNGAISAGLNHAYHVVETGILQNQLNKVFANYPMAQDEYGNYIELSPKQAFEKVSPAALQAHLDGYYTNACATRLSLAFADAGVKIPHYKRYGGIKDLNGNRIIISAARMSEFMHDRYGALRIDYSRATSTNGIYIGLTGTGGVSGHVTIVKSGFFSSHGGYRTQHFWAIP